MTAARERRRFPRQRFPDATRVVRGRIRPGVQVRVLDLSPCGGLIETAARLLPGARVELLLDQHFSAPIRASVVRSWVGSVGAARIVFQGGLQFDTLIPVTSAAAEANDDSRGIREGDRRPGADA